MKVSVQASITLLMKVSVQAFSLQCLPTHHGGSVYAGADVADNNDDEKNTDGW